MKRNFTMPSLKSPPETICKKDPHEVRTQSRKDL